MQTRQTKDNTIHAAKDENPKLLSKGRNIKANRKTEIYFRFVGFEVLSKDGGGLASLLCFLA